MDSREVKTFKVNEMYLWHDHNIGMVCVVFISRLNSEHGAVYDPVSQRQHKVPYSDLYDYNSSNLTRGD